MVINTNPSFPVAFSFLVVVSDVFGMYEGNFQEVSGLNAKIGVEELKEGGENRYTHRLPTPPKYENLILKRGMIVNSTLINWVKDAVENFTFTTKTVVVSLLDEKSLPVAVWSFANAYPVALKISDFKAQENAIACETIELSYDYFKRIL